MREYAPVSLAMPVNSRSETLAYRCQTNETTKKRDKGEKEGTRERKVLYAIPLQVKPAIYHAHHTIQERAVNALLLLAVKRSLHVLASLKDLVFFQPNMHWY